MRKLVMIAIVGFLVLRYLEDQGAPPVSFQPAPVAPQVVPSPPSQFTRPARVASFTCDGRQHCSQMRSREEAEFFVSSCPNTRMDGDNDGVPCENDSRF
jgi:hypothetical protein